VRYCLMLRTAIPILWLSLGSVHAQDLRLDVVGDSAPKIGSMSKATLGLHQLYRDYMQYQAQTVTTNSHTLERPFTPANPLLQVIGGAYVLIEAAGDDADALRQELRNLGLRNDTTIGPMVSGLFPIENINAMVAVRSLRFARPAMSVRSVGSVTSQGDVAMQTDQLRSRVGVNGSGVTVGTLSDSYDCYSELNRTPTADEDVATNDLPKDVTVLKDFSDTLLTCDPNPNIMGDEGSDEGRALMQLIHDVAPAARQAFHTAFGGQTVFAQGIENLATQASADVIVDDIIYLAEPMFQDGIIAQAVDRVKKMGVAYFSSAGNAARHSYEGRFRSSGKCPVGSPQFCDAHDFDPDVGVDIFQRITVPEGREMILSLQWDQSFFSASGSEGAESDIDIFITDDPPTTVLAYSTDRNKGNDPVEILEYRNPVGSGENTFNILITKRLAARGPDPGRMKYVLFNFRGTIEEYDTQGPTIFGHANAEGAETVGAVFYGDTIPLGTNPPLLESFSSAGGTPILLDGDGNRLAEELKRPKPEIVGPDGTNTTFFGTTDVEGDTFPNFFGTSAAAPHAAALAALLLTCDMTQTPDDLYSTLEDTALDMGPEGFDFDSGYGFVDAMEAGKALCY
jgi:subtilisin family serine protease